MPHCGTQTLAANNIIINNISNRLLEPVLLYSTGITASAAAASRRRLAGCRRQDPRHRKSGALAWLRCRSQARSRREPASAHVRDHTVIEHLSPAAPSEQQGSLKISQVELVQAPEPAMPCMAIPARVPV